MTIKYDEGVLYFDDKQQQVKLEKEIKKLSNYAKKKKEIIEQLLGDDFVVVVNLQIIPKKNEGEF